MRQLHTRLIPIVVVLALASAGCAMKAPPEAPMVTKLAYTGIQAADWIGAAQEVIGAIGRTVPDQAVKEKSIKLLESLQQANTLGISLVPLLRLIDQTDPPPVAELARASATITEIQTAVTQVAEAVRTDDMFKESTPSLLRSLTEIRSMQLGVASLQEKVVQP